MDRSVAMGIAVLALGCAPDDTAQQEHAVEGRVTEVLQSYDVSSLNADLVAGEPTTDLALYVTDSGPVSWEQLQGQIVRAKRIFADAGVQLRVSQARLIRVPEEWLSLEPFLIETPTDPPLESDDLYDRLDDRRARLTDSTTAIVTDIVSTYVVPANGVPADAVVHVITLSEAPIPFYEWDGSAWIYDTAPTGGMSFPPYYFADRIEPSIRGLISISTGGTRTLAHELGHKLINVSHEGGDTCPAFAAYGPHLMLYGNGEEIAAGSEGRWHRERLSLSPFVHREIEGQAVFEHHFEDGGIYADGLYGDYVVDPPCGE